MTAPDTPTNTTVTTEEISYHWGNDQAREDFIQELISPDDVEF